MIEVFLDLDGVLVDFVNGACRHHGVKNPYLNPLNHGNYELADLLEMPHETFWGGMGYNFWSQLDWLIDGPEIIRAIMRYVSPKQVTLLTSPIQTPGCIDGKMHWINKHLPQWRRQFLVGPPKHVIAGPGKLLIDDFDKNVDKWVTRKDGTPTGGTAIQVPRMMNRLHKLPTIDYVQQRLAEYFK
jgi:hypothetical protein